MKRNVDDLVRKNMHKEQELHASIRSAFDQSYEQIRQQSKKKAKKSWLKPVSAAVAVLALSSTILLTNDTALAKLQAFFGINDPGLETAINNGDLQYIAQTQQSENITITLDKLFADAYRLGLQLTIESNHISKENLNYLSFEYRLFDAEGKEINAHVSDTKEIVGPGIYSGGEFELTDVKNNIATLELLEESTTTTAPSLEGAQLVVETVHFLNNEGGITSVDGEWAFDLTSASVVTQVYVAENSVPGLTLEQATITNGSMQVSYKIDGIDEDENDIFETALVNGNGGSFYAKSANVERLNEEQQTVISLVFPYSVWNEQQLLSLKVKGYEELKLVKKE
ncbi:DUF4179 domain-containing protein [Psychrobacillus psychrodurans]|uniref:DUF4179 domain-containing protein n=1 Tax=Psychrobacillus psychrodurans TaxID=126157 RepID=UPI001F4EFB62|nr:DUF4179 domain-containing protein [Psychrobacillus psychrodurans]MCK1998876.1 DUF4179 domain-containing protein [Psychrobacillus psychrodurans]